MRELDLQLPPELAEALGYDGSARWVAIHEQAELGLRWSDGYTGAAANEEVWAAFHGHERVLEALGMDPFEGQRAILIDRWRERLSHGELVEIRLFLSSQPSELEALRQSSSLPPARVLEELLHEREVRRLERERRLRERGVTDEILRIEAWATEHY